jgi:hypothetical protein
MSNNLPTGKTDYEVGYGKPPKSTRFKKGKSGNPNGRPKGAKTNMSSFDNKAFSNLIYKEAYRKITVSGEHGPTKMSIAQAAIRTLSVNAVKGDLPSQRVFFNLLGKRSNVVPNDDDEKNKPIIMWGETIKPTDFD